MWGGGANLGEFGVTGTTFTPNDDPGANTFVTPLNNGVAIADDAIGSGYLMYSVESVHDRFAGPNSPHPLNANHLIGVRYNGGWEYNDNYVWVPFTPVASDVLLASANFSADTVTSLEGTGGTSNGVTAGYASGDLVFSVNVWGGEFNLGEFGITGTSFVANESPGSTIFVTPVNNGVAVTDNAVGTGYLMYSAQNVFDRFAGVNVPHPLNANHLIAVRYNGGWQYNDNLTWNSFTPVASDVLLATADFSSDTVTSLEGTGGSVNGITSGYASGDLTFAPNIWGGDFNPGEFGVTGTSFVPNGALTAASKLDITMVLDGNDDLRHDDGHDHEHDIEDGLPFVGFDGPGELFVPSSLNAVPSVSPISAHLVDAALKDDAGALEARVTPILMARLAPAAFRQRSGRSEATQSERLDASDLAFCEHAFASDGEGGWL